MVGGEQQKKKKNNQERNNKNWKQQQEEQRKYRRQQKELAHIERQPLASFYSLNVRSHTYTYIYTHTNTHVHEYKHYIHWITNNACIWHIFLLLYFRSKHFNDVFIVLPRRLLALAKKKTKNKMVAIMARVKVAASIENNSALLRESYMCVCVGMSRLYSVLDVVYVCVRAEVMGFGAWCILVDC